MNRHVIFGCVVAAIIILWGASWYFIPQWYDKTSLEAGTFGDMFGAVNSLFSGLAFAGLIYTITVQRQELSLQREAIKMQTEELKLQREETARSADQLEKQQGLMNLQTAITTVNELIKIKNKRIDTFINDGKQGLDALSDLLVESQSGVRYKPEVDYYFRTIYEPFFFILRYISDLDMENDEQKDLLAKLLDVDTTNEEIDIIFHAFSENSEKMELLIRYGFDKRLQFYENFPGI
ncbi:hypothetical protein [Paenibacillus xylanexedens]|uniref:hypothetical protein n=1 Tax=Paenibacillus xylanexedens TaxID=528191 RepID=UPI00119E5E1C|nr:hypothetical protein [Paenibacillus xylanexedens]